MFGNSKKWRRLAALLAFIILSLNLAACGYNSSAATQTRIAQTITPAVQLPPITVTVGNDTAAPEVTSTPFVFGTATPTTSTAANSSKPATSPTKAATATPGPTLTPTPAGTAEKIDKDAELKLVKTAYDAILKHLYKAPDTAKLLQAGLEELGKVTGVAPPQVDFGTDADANWNLFKDAYNKNLDASIAQGFKYPKNQLGDRLVNALADAVGDEHTYYLNTSGYDSRQRLLNGDNSSIGFGIQISLYDEQAYMVRVVPNSPADKAGLKNGDKLVAYDGTPISGKNWQIIRDAKENETHQFSIERLNQPQTIVISVPKQKYVIPTVEYRMINGHTGYVAIREFFTNVAEETNKALVDLQKQGADSWIIDVRNNPGGVNVDQVVGRFVQGGEIMGYNIDRRHRDPLKVTNDGVTGEYKGKPFTPLLPMVLLINDNSASSSEILAEAVRDFKLGTLVGTKTAGALGHTAAYPIGDGSAISVTLDEYESKGGARLNGIGVSPDVQVDLSIADLVANRDLQLNAAIEQLEKTLAKK